MLRSDFLSRQKELGKIKRKKAIELADINISNNNTSYILVLLIFPHLFRNCLLLSHSLMTLTKICSVHKLEATQNFLDKVFLIVYGAAFLKLYYLIIIY